MNLSQFYINFISIIVYQFYIKCSSILYQLFINFISSKKLNYFIISYIQFEETDLNTPNVFCN